MASISFCKILGHWRLAGGGGEFSIGVSWGLSEIFSLRNGIGGYRKSWQVLEQSVKSSILVVGYQTRFPPNGGWGRGIY